MSKCKYEGVPIPGTVRQRRCEKNAKLDGWCAVHHPDAEAARRDASRREWEKEHQRRAWFSRDAWFPLVCAALDQERAKVEKLLRMARHDYECMADAGTYNDGPWPCTCGLSALLSGRGEGQ